MLLIQSALDEGIMIVDGAHSVQELPGYRMT